MYQKVKGTQDFFNLDVEKFRYFEKVVTNIIKKYGYEEIITPIFEHTDVFVRSSGEESDLVSKEMYTFLDKGNRSITLRPEGTAGVVRSYIENKMYAQQNLKKLYYLGPMFRYERPQAGRYRQFYQFGVEAFGMSSALLDADVILSAARIFEALGIKNIKLHINSIGDLASRTLYAEVLKEYFSKDINHLCGDCQSRIHKNPLRILDCKVDKDNPLLINAPKIGASLSDEAIKYFKEVLEILKAAGLDYEVNENLVRGLDYYTDTVFEFVYQGDDAMDGLTICGGGKYSNLVKSFGGPDIPGVGYAFGVERILSIMAEQNLYPTLKEKTKIVLIALDPVSKIQTLVLADSLRKKGYEAELDYFNYNLRPQFKLADRLHPDFIIIIGEEERSKKQLTIKNKIANTQDTILEEELFTYLKENYHENA